VDQVWPRREFIPASESAVIATGTVVRYNLTYRVIVPASTLRSRYVLRDDIQIDNLGTTQLGKRYVFFARAVHDATDISLADSYELRDGNVVTNDSRPSRPISNLPGVPKTLASEASFVEAVRREVRKQNKSVEVASPNSRNL
jgi:hypothetical protein